MPDLPYPGLRPFQPEETHKFFGRESQTDDLLGRLAESRFLAVIGPSGCGKSSLVNTGLIASLEMGLLAGAGERWTVVRMQPRSEPLHNLAAALINSSVIRAHSENDELSGEAGFRLWVENTLKRGPLGLKDVLDRYPLPDKTNLLVVVDQFEEVFRYRHRISQEEADAFVALLLRSVQIPDIPIYVVITMRSDFLGQCTVFPSLPEMINNGQFLTPRLTREEIKAAIEGPAEVYGGKIAPALTNRLLNAIGSSDDQLPVLQHALMRMWTVALEEGLNTTVPQIVEDESPPVDLKLDTYRKVGGLEKALSNHADEAFNELVDDEHKLIARGLFTALTERTSSNVDIRRPVTVQEVAEIVNASVDDAIAVADRFRRPGRSFIVPSKAELPILKGDTELDISHEALIRQWKRLAGWVEEEYEAARNYRRLEDSALLWDNKDAGLLSEIEVDRLLKWRDDYTPNEVWASRYGKNFGLAMKYLDESRDERDRLRREKIKQQKERYQSRLLKRIAWLTGGGLIMTLLLSITAGVGWIEADSAKEKALTAKDQADKQTEVAVQKTIALQAQKTSLDAFSQKNYTMSQLMRLIGSRALGEGSIEATSLLLDGLTKNNLIRKIARSGEGRIYSVALSNDDEHIALAGKSGSETNTDCKKQKGFKGGVVQIRDRTTWEPMVRLDKHCEGVTSISFSPDEHSRYLAAGDFDGKVYLWDVDSGEVNNVLDAQEGGVLKVIYSRLPDGNEFVISTGNKVAKPREAGRALIWQVHNGSVLSEQPAYLSDDSVLNVAYAANTGMAVLLTTSETDARSEIQITRWDVGLNEALEESLSLHRCENEDGQNQKCFSDLTQIAVSSSGERLATLAENNKILLWDMGHDRSPTKIAMLSGHRANVLALQFHDDSRLASSSRDGEIFLWDVSNEAVDNAELLDRKTVWANGPKLPLLHPEIQLPAQNDWVRSLSFNTDGAELASTSGENLMLWSIGDNRILARVMRHDSQMEAWGLALHGDHLLTGGNKDELVIWEDSAEPTDPVNVSLNDEQAKITSLSVNSSKKLLAVADFSGKLLLGDLSSLDQANPMITLDDDKIVKDFGWKIFGVAFSPDGQFLAVSGVNGELVVLEQIEDAWVVTAIERTDLDDDQWRVTGWGDNLVFSDDSRRLFFATEKPIPDRGAKKEYSIRSVGIPQTPSTPPVYELRGDVENKILTLAYSSKCGDADPYPCLLSGGLDNQVQVWKLQEGELPSPQQFSGHRDRINTVAISPDGKTIASGSRDTTIRLWDLASGEEIGVLNGHTGYVNRVAFSPDGKWLYSASDDQTIIRTNVNFKAYSELVCETIDRNLTSDEWNEFKKSFSRENELEIEDEASYLNLCPG